MAVKIVGSRRNRVSFLTLIMVIVAGILLFAAAGLFGFKMYKQMEKEYQDKIAVYEEELDIYKSIVDENTRTVYIPHEEIKFNTVLEEDMFYVEEIFSSIPQEDFIDETDLGKVATLDVPAGNPVLKYMVEDQLIPDDVRNVEFSTFMLQSNIREGDFIDVRIRFPNGEDYIVLSKKKVEGIRLQTSTIWLNIKHGELMTVSSAIVDAYLKEGTKLYVVKYVDAQTQNRARETYPVNDHVRKIMREDPNILEKASNVLSEQARMSLEERLENVLGDHMKSAISDELSGLNSNVQEVLKQEAANQRAIGEKESADGQAAKEQQKPGSGQNNEKGSVIDGDD